MHMEFARKLNRRAVADVGQFLERDVPGDVPLDIVLDQFRMGRPETSLRAGHFEMHGRIFSQDVHAGLKRQRIVAEAPARTSRGNLLNHLIADPGQDRIVDSEQVVELDGLRVAIESLARSLRHKGRRDVEMARLGLSISLE